MARNLMAGKLSSLRFLGSGTISFLTGYRQRNPERQCLLVLPEIRQLIYSTLAVVVPQPPLSPLGQP